LMDPVLSIRITGFKQFKTLSRNCFAHFAPHPGPHKFSRKIILQNEMIRSPASTGSPTTSQTASPYGRY
jgi:hypothetical protein